MNKFRHTLHLTGLVIAGSIVYVFYGFFTAEVRIKEVCNQIKPGMSITDLRAFGAQHGLNPPHSGSGINFMVEARTFGRHGCKVDLESDVVKHVEYNFAD